MTKQSPLLIAGFALLLGGTPAAAKTVDTIAAVVNNNIITLTDVKERTALYLSDEKIPADARQEMEQKVLNKLIDEKLELQQAKKLGISISEEQVNAGFAFIAKRNHLSPDTFKDQLKAAGVNIDTLYAQIKAEIAWDQVIQREIKPQINVSENDIDLTMKTLRHSTKKEYHIAEIMLQVPAAKDRQTVHARADKLVQKIRQGADFASVARHYSQAPGAESGGDLGWVEGGQLSQPLDQALASLQVGQISDPVFANGGYHILFLLNTRAVADAADNAAEAGDGATNGTAAEPTPDSSPLVTLKQIVIPFSAKDPDSIIQAKMARGAALAGQVKSCADMDKEMKNFPYKGTGTLGSGPQNALPSPLRGVVEKLPVNQLSKPIQSPSGWVMIMVCARQTPPSPRAATQDNAAQPPDNAAQPPDKLSATPAEAQERADIANKLGMQRLGQMAAHYLSDLRAAAFIDKRI